jgi:hypothetical protein
LRTLKVKSVGILLDQVTNRINHLLESNKIPMAGENNDNPKPIPGSMQAFMQDKNNLESRETSFKLINQKYDFESYKKDLKKSQISWLKDHFNEYGMVTNGIFAAT